MRFFCIAFVMFITCTQSFGSCIILGNEILKNGNEVVVFFARNKKYLDNRISVIQKQVGLLGTLSYGKVEKATHISLVRTEVEFRNTGVQNAIYKYFIQFERPEVIVFSLGDTNRDVFIESMGEVLGFNYPLNNFYHKRLIEKYIIKHLNHIHPNSFKDAFTRTPAYKSAIRYGYDTEFVRVEVYLGGRDRNKAFLRIKVKQRAIN